MLYFMTKILYIPTAEYIVFCSRKANEKFTSVLEEISLESYEILRQSIKSGMKDPYIFYLCNRVEKNSVFSDRNNLKFPLLGSEFEVIND